MLSATVIIVEVISYKSSLGCPGENFIPYVINYSADGGVVNGILERGDLAKFSVHSRVINGNVSGSLQQ